MGTTSVGKTRQILATGSECEGNASAFLRANAKFDGLLNYGRTVESRIWLFYHASYLDAFARTPPYRRLSPEMLGRICFLLDVDLPADFKNPEDRRTFTFHAEKARRELGWRKLNRTLGANIQQWLGWASPNLCTSLNERI